MKALVTKAWLFALLLLASALILVACGSAGGGQQDSGSGDGEQGKTEKTAGMMAGMDHDQMGHGEMGMGSKSMARQMIMENGKYSDRRFIDAMVPHHQGAIEMANVALKNAEHEEIKELSRNIVSTQRAEIEELKAIKKEEFGTSNVPMEMSPSQMRSMGMMDPQELAHSDPFDRAFINAMIPHHQSAIEMAKVAHEKSKIPEIKELAENIVRAQQKEIKQMRQWRQEWFPEGQASETTVEHTDPSEDPIAAAPVAPPGPLDTMPTGGISRQVLDQPAPACLRSLALIRVVPQGCC